MIESSTTSTLTAAPNVDEPVVPDVVGEGPDINSLGFEEAGTLSVSYSEASQDPDADPDPPLDGDGTNTDGLPYPEFSIDLKEVMLALNSLQADVTEIQVTLTSDQIDELSAKQMDLAETNVQEFAQARDDMDAAQMWSDVAKYAGFASIGLTVLAGFTCPALWVAAGCMIATTALSETGTTQDMINTLGGGNSAFGTVATAAIIIGIAGVATVASGGMAGLTVATTLGPALISNPENLQALGVSSEAAVWLSLGIGISASLIGGFAGAKMASSTAKAAASTDDAAQVASNLDKADDLASATSEVAEATDTGTDAVTTANTATQATTTASNTAARATTVDDAVDIVETTTDAGEQLDDVAEHAQDVVNEVNRARVESQVETATQQAANLSNDAAKMSMFATKVNAVTMFVQGIVDIMGGAASWVSADFKYKSDVRTANTNERQAEGDYASSRQTAWETLHSQFMGGYMDNLSGTSDAFAVLHASTSGKLQAY